MKKSTTARIEDTLDIVAEKIIDLERTAKQMDQLKRDISEEISRFENITVKVNTSVLKNEQNQFIEKATSLNNHYLAEVDKKNKIHRPLYYLILFLLIALLGLFATVVILQNKNKSLQSRIEWYVGQEMKKE